MSNDSWHPSLPSDDNAPAFVLSYASEFDPPPGEDGYFLDIAKNPGYGIFPASITPERMLQWRRYIIDRIRFHMGRLGAPEGTNFHQLIRLEKKLPMTEEPHVLRDREQEDARLVAEYEWELRQCNLAYPTDVTELFRMHVWNTMEEIRSW